MISALTSSGKKSSELLSYGLAPFSVQPRCIFHLWEYRRQGCRVVTLAGQKSPNRKTHGAHRANWGKTRTEARAKARLCPGKAWVLPGLRSGLCPGWPCGFHWFSGPGLPGHARAEIRQSPDRARVLPGLCQGKARAETQAKPGLCPGKARALPGQNPGKARGPENPWWLHAKRRKDTSKISISHASLANIADDPAFGNSR